jgi:hypothetical protein
MFPGVPGAGGYGDLFGGGGMPGMGGGMGIPGMGGGDSPSAKGYGIAGPTPVIPYDTGMGLQPGTPVQGFQNGDMTQAGAAETQFANNAARYDAPGAASQFWEGVQGALKPQGMGEQFAGSKLGQYAQGTPGVTNNSQAQYQSSLGAAPNISANLDPFYANEQRKALEDIDRAMAARGMMGSSHSMDRAQEAITNLAADKARADAQYGLQYSGDRRAWEGLQGQLAGQADNQSQAGSQNELSWLRGLGDLALSGQNAGLSRLGQAGGFAGQADSADLSRLNAGMGAAGQAQNAQQGRLGDLFGMYTGLGNQMAGMAGNAYDDMLAGDQQLMDAQMGMNLGLGSEILGQDYRTQQKIKDDFDWAYEKIPVLGAMSGGGK